MADDISVKLAVEGEQNFKTAINAANAQLKAMDAELQAAVSSMTGMESAEQKLAAKSGVLNQQIEKNKEKLSILSQQYEKSKAKLDELGQALEKAKTEHGEDSAEATKAANAYNKQAQEVAKLETQMSNTTAAINTAEGELKQLAAAAESSADSWAQLGEKMEQTGAAVSGVGEKITGVGTAMTKGITVPLAAIGTAAGAAWKEVDDGLDTVAIKTGATGQALQDLQQSMKNVAASVPTDFQTAGDAVGEVNTRLGLTGQTLEDLSVKFIQFAKLNNTDVSSSIDQVQKVLSAFNLGAEDAGAMLDTLNAVGQETGASMDKLAQGMVDNAASFQEMNMGAADAAEFLGQLEKSGVDSTTVLTGLKKALSNAAKSGTPMSEAMKQVQDAMVNAEDSTEAMQIAIDLFGTKAGPTIAKACKSGQLSFESFGNSIQDNLGNVQQTFEATMDAPDRLNMVLNDLKITGADLASTFLTTAEPAIESVSETVKDACEKFQGLDEGTKQNIVQAGLLAAATGPVVTGIGKVTEGAGKLIEKGGNLVSVLSSGTIELGAMAGPATVAAVAIVGLGAAFVNAAIDANSMDDATRAVYDAMENTTSAAEAQRKEIESNAGAALGLVDSLEELAGKENKSAAEKEQMKSLVSQLNSMVPGLSASYDDMADSLNMSTDAMRDFIVQSAKTQALESYQSELADLYKQQYEALSNLNEKKTAATSANDSYNATIAEQNRLLEQGTIDQSMYNDKVAVARVEVDNTNRALNDAQQAYDDITAKVQECEGNLVGYTEATGDAASGTEDLSEAQATAADSAEEMTEAERDAAEAFAQMVTDLEGVPELLSATGYSSQELAIMLTEAGVSVDQFASGVSSMRDSVVNDFQLLSESQKTTADEMVAALQANLQVQQEWSSNLTQLWWDAYAEQDTAVMQYISHLADLGPEYASAVAEFANGGYSKLVEAASAWAAIGDQSAQDYTAAIAMNNYLAEQAGADIGAAVIAGGQSVDASTVGQEYVDKVVGTITGNQSAAESAMAGMGEGMGEGMADAYENTKSVAEAAVDTVTEGMIQQIKDSYEDMKSAGAGLVKYLNAGMASNLSEARAVAESVAEAAKEAAGAVDFMPVGFNISAGIASGISSGRSGVVSAATNVVNAAVAAAKRAADIHSPSRVTENEVGYQYTAGIAKGMVNTGALKALDGAADRIKDVILGQLDDIDKTTSSISAPLQITNYVTKDDLYNATSGIVNGMSIAMTGTQTPTAVTIPLYINGMKIAEATLADFRTVSKANPEVVSDR